MPLWIAQRHMCLKGTIRCWNSAVQKRQRGGNRHAIVSYADQIGKAIVTHPCLDRRQVILTIVSRNVHSVSPFLSAFGAARNLLLVWLVGRSEAPPNQPHQQQISRAQRRAKQPAH